MTANALLQLALYLALLIACAVPLGGYMGRVYSGEARWAQRLGGPLERVVYGLACVDPREDMAWSRYAHAVLLFNFLGALCLYALQRFQAWLPLNPGDMSAVPSELAFNTAVSFATNTNWQPYGGETSLSHLTQMLGLGVQNFLSAATGMAVLVAFIGGFTQRSAQGLGSFWVDLVRSTLYVLLPLSFVWRCCWSPRAPCRPTSSPPSSVKPSDSNAWWVTCST